MDGRIFEIVTDGPDAYIRVDDVIAILSSDYSPKDRDQVAEMLQSIVRPMDPRELMN